MNALWVTCRVIAVALLALVIVGTAADMTFAELADGVVFLVAVAFAVVSIVGAVLCIGLIVSLFLETWKDR